MLQCDVSELAKTIWPLIKADIPVFIHGESGIGKSQVIREELMPMVAQAYGESVLHDFRLSTKDTVDGTGMPIVVDDDANTGKRATEWTQPAFIPRDDGRMHVVFLDEVGHASVAMQHAVGYQLTHDRALGEFKLPKLNRVILALNTRSAKGGDNKLAKPFENRGAHVLVTSKAKGWLEYALRRGLDPRLIAFIKIKPDELHKMNENSPAWSSPRTIEMVGRIMKGESDPRVIERCAQALCGEGFAKAFGQFIRDLAAKLPRPEDIKRDPDGAKVPDESHHQQVVAAAISELIDPKSVDIWARYLNRLEPDIRSMAANSAMARDENLRNNATLKSMVMA